MGSFKLNRLLPGLPDTVTCGMIPRVDQFEDLNKILTWDKAAIYSEVGTGKSLISYLYIMWKLHQGKGVVVVMPPPLIPQYMANFEVIEGHGFSFGVIHKKPKQRHEEMDVWDATGWPDVLFLSFQMYLKYKNSIQNVGTYQVFVCDEAHVLSRVTNKIYQAVFAGVWGRNLDLLVMTATPNTTELITAYGQIRLRNPGAYTSLSQFERLHVTYKHRQLTEKLKIKEIVGYRDIPNIEAKLMHHAVRRRAKDVLSLVAPTIVAHKVELGTDHAELYSRLLAERMLEMGDELLVARNQQSLRQMALQIVTNKSKYTLDDFEDAPFDNLLAIIDTIDLTTTKLIIFVNFVGTVKRLHRKLAKYNPALIYGESDTQNNVDKLLGDATCRVGILNFTSGGSGFNLQSVCHHVVVYEAIGSPGMLEQAIGRVQRSGQLHPVVVWLFRYSMTISNKLYSKAYRRAAELQEALKDPSSFVDYLTSSPP